MPKVPYPYDVNDKLVTGDGSLIPISSLSNRFLLPSLTVQYRESYSSIIYVSRLCNVNYTYMYLKLHEIHK